ncbi:hypothetical protein K443DRAFT_678857 [Laccaria amethystina LaAM-08-1]|uniref:Uncharacterized protein n=1 Tax=Laccaria amethystina LaAM-08-1 TaxID=1095629 RepID=A0A0C9XSU6_9AGAR|nr:hypothetical protein K443DRAFT_678857 [Laccaria amethystina LaAM-08-1]
MGRGIGRRSTYRLATNVDHLNYGGGGVHTSTEVDHSDSAKNGRCDEEDKKILTSSIRQSPPEIWGVRELSQSCTERGRSTTWTKIKRASLP